MFLLRFVLVFDVSFFFSVFLFLLTISPVNGLTVPTITGCPATSPTNANVNAILVSATATTVRPAWTQPTSNVAPVAIPAGAISGNYDFSQGLTTIKYVFGTTGAQAVCTFYVYVRGKCWLYRHTLL